MNVCCKIADYIPSQLGAADTANKELVQDRKKDNMRNNIYDNVDIPSTVPMFTELICTARSGIKNLCQYY